MADYDRSIHGNPDAAAWAKFFMETSQRMGWSGPDEGTMTTWFANAMMAMHDHLKPAPSPASAPPYPATPDHIQFVRATEEQIDAFNMRPGRWVIYFEAPAGQRAQCFADLSRYPGIRPASAPAIHSDQCVGRVHDSLGCSCGAASAPAPQTEGARPVSVQRSKEWWLAKADAEGTLSVGASTAPGAPEPTPEEIAEIREYAGFDAAVAATRSLGDEPAPSLLNEAAASVALDHDPDMGTHSVDDGCPGGHREPSPSRSEECGSVFPSGLHHYACTQPKGHIPSEAHSARLGSRPVSGLLPPAPENKETNR